MSDFIQHPKFFYTQEAAEVFGRELVGENGVFQVRRVPMAPIAIPGPKGTASWQEVAEYAVFTPRYR